MDGDGTGAICKRITSQQSGTKGSDNVLTTGMDARTTARAAEPNGASPGDGEGSVETIEDEEDATSGNATPHDAIRSRRYASTFADSSSSPGSMH